jgi:prepilin-type N-terminal cleavage/methylation domain-containing protein
MRRNDRRCRGFSLTELTATLAILAVTAMLSIPAAAEISRQLTMRAACNEIAAIFTRARAMAVFEHRDVGIRWTSLGGDVTFAVYQDMNGNGVLTEEIRKGIDVLVEGPVSMKRRYPGISFSFLPGFTALDPNGDPIGNLSDPIKFGRSDICTFTPLGNASPGSIYLSNGRNRQAIVRISPSSARIQIFEWETGRRAWNRL